MPFHRLTQSLTSSVEERLRLLLYWRTFAAVAMLLIALWQAPALPAMVAVAMLMVGLLMHSWQVWRDSEAVGWHLAAYLVWDLAGFSFYLWWQDGGANPLVSYFYVLVTLSALLLSRILSWLFLAATIASYTLLMLALPHASHMHDMFSQHLWGMWVNFVGCTILLTLFINGLQQQINAKQLALDDALRQQSQSEQMVALGTLAATTAHELGTPLSTMAVIIEDKINESSEREWRILEQQLGRCKQALNQLRHYQYRELPQISQAQASECFLRIEDSVRLLFPELKLALIVEQDAVIATDDLLQQALVNLYANAHQANATQVTTTIRCRGETAVISIEDDGDGMHTGVTLSGIPVSSKQFGMGIGVYLTRFIVERFGGRLDIQALAHGVRVDIELPVFTV